MAYKTKWQNDYAEKVFAMTAQEIFNEIAFGFIHTDIKSEEDIWKHNLLTQSFQIRMGWVKVVFIEDNRTLWSVVNTE